MTSGQAKNTVSYRDSDSRYLPRWETRNQAYFQLEHDVIPREAVTKNLHCSGACLILPDQLPEPQKIKVTIHLSQYDRIRLNGNVVWSRQIDDENCVGISFRDVPQKTQDMILEHAFEINREGVLRHWFKGWEGSS